MRIGSPFTEYLTQEGDGFPTDQITNRLTPLPSPLAIGATWNPEYARQVGSVAGEELSALGINLLLGPSLDVNETPRTEGSGDLGVRSFGGDPFWVGEMARAYIRGVHEGSQDRIFRRKVLIERSNRYPGPNCDLVRCRTAVALFGKHFRGGYQYGGYRLPCPLLPGVFPGLVPSRRVGGYMS